MPDNVTPSPRGEGRLSDYSITKIYTPKYWLLGFRPHFFSQPNNHKARYVVQRGSPPPNLAACSRCKYPPIITFCLCLHATALWVFSLGQKYIFPVFHKNPQTDACTFYATVFWFPSILVNIYFEARNMTFLSLLNFPCVEWILRLWVDRIFSLWPSGKGLPTEVAEAKSQIYLSMSWILSFFLVFSPTGISPLGTNMHCELFSGFLFLLWRNNYLYAHVHRSIFPLSTKCDSNMTRGRSKYEETCTCLFLFQVWLF